MRILQSDWWRAFWPTTAYNLRTRFFQDMLFSQNDIANYETSFKTLKVMLSPLKCQIFHSCSRFVLLTQLSRQQIQFSKTHLVTFLSIYEKISSCKKWVDPEKNLSQTDGQTDGQTNWTDFIGPLTQKWSFNHVFQKFEKNFS